MSFGRRVVLDALGIKHRSNNKQHVHMYMSSLSTIMQKIRMEIGFSVERVLHTPVILPRNQFSYPSAVYYSIVTLLRLRPRAHTALTTKNDSFKNRPIADSTLRRTDRRHSRAGNMLHPALLCSTIQCKVNYSLTAWYRSAVRV